MLRTQGVPQREVGPLPPKSTFSCADFNSVSHLVCFYLMGFRSGKRFLDSWLT